MSIEQFTQYLFAGITYGIIYAIVAIGFNIIYNTTGIINFAQGEFVMLGGMIAITLEPLMPMPVAIALSVAATLAAGPRHAIQFTKRALNQWLLQAGPIFDHAMALEMLGFFSEDLMAGVESLRARKPPRFPSATVED